MPAQAMPWEIGSHLKEARRCAGFSRYAVEEHTREAGGPVIQRYGLKRYEDGVRNPSLAVLVRLAELYGISLDKLIGRER